MSDTLKTWGPLAAVLAILGAFVATLPQWAPPKPEPAVTHEEETPDLQTYFEADVTRIVDGDTVDIRTPGGASHRIRINGIDAPEKAQDYGDESADNLRAFLQDGKAQVFAGAQDRYGRPIGDLKVGQRWASAEQVKSGWAWHYKAYSADKKLAALETEARQFKRGLWQGANPQPPWEWRRARRSKQQQGQGQ